MVRVEGGKVVIDDREFPLEQVTGVFAEEWRPRYWPWACALALAVPAIPALNAYQPAAEQLLLLPYGVVAVVIFGAIFRFTFGDATYTLVVELAGRRKVALKSTDHQLIISVLADAQGVLRDRTHPPG